MQMIECNACKETVDVLPFTVPNDEAGIALMQAHLKDEHGVDAKITTRR